MFLFFVCSGVIDCYRGSVRGQAHMRGQTPAPTEVDGEHFRILAHIIGQDADTNALQSDFRSQSDD